MENRTVYSCASKYAREPDRKKPKAALAFGCGMAAGAAAIILLLARILVSAKGGTR